MSFISANVLAMTRSTHLHLGRAGYKCSPAWFLSNNNQEQRDELFIFTFTPRRFTARARRDVRGVKERRVAGRPCMAKPNALIQVEGVRFGAGRVRSHSHMPRLDQRLAFSSQRFRLITIITSRVWAP